MSIQKAALNSLASVLLSNDVWVHAKALVAAIENTDPTLTGAEKHKAVITELEAIGGDVGTTLLNLAVEMACVYLKIGV